MEQDTINIQMPKDLPKDTKDTIIVVAKEFRERSESEKLLAERMNAFSLQYLTSEKLRPFGVTTQDLRSASSGDLSKYAMFTALSAIDFGCYLNDFPQEIGECPHPKQQPIQQLQSEFSPLIPMCPVNLVFPDLIGDDK